MGRFDKLDELKQELDSLRPLPQAVVQNLHEDLVLRWTYNSNAIEGNTLTLKETKVALEGITVGGRTLREHFEAVNHREAIFYVEDVVRRNDSFSEAHIKAIHSLIMKNIDDDNAGVYRKVNVTVSGAQSIPPDFIHIPSYMENLTDWYHRSVKELHPVELSARLHSDFVKIHPFTDGNGRTARLLMNLELMKAGFPAVILPVERRLEYYETLDTSHVTGNYETFINLIVSLSELSFQPYRHALGIKADA
jgi:Fic family protein